MKIFTLCLLLMTLKSAFADILGFKYVDTLGAEKQAQDSQKFLNPTSDYKVVLSGGLDTKINIKITDGVGKVWENITTEIIGPSDRLTFNGEDYYGKVITLDSGIPDGTYTISNTLLSNANERLKYSTYEVVYDRVAPTSTAEHKFTIQSWGGGSIDRFQFVAGRELSLSGISDENSGLSNAQIFTEINGVYKEKSAILDTVEGIVRWKSNGRGGDVSHLFSVARGNYHWGFNVYDQAGNKAQLSRTSMYDSVCPSFEISDVYNPKTSSWEAYKPGMTVWENPTKYRFRALKETNIHVSGDELGWTWTPNHVDDTYAYKEMNRYFPKSRSYSTFYTTAGFCRTWHQNMLYATLDSSVELGPQGAGVNYQVKIGDEPAKWMASGSPRHNKPYVITSIRVFAKARSYDQTLHVSYAGSCTLPAGQTSCDIATNIIRADDGSISQRGYRPWATYVGNSEYSAHTGYLYETWDFTAPEITGLSIANNKAYMTVIDHDTSNTWTASWWRPVSIRIEAINFRDSSKVDLAQLEQVSNSYNSQSFVFSLDTLSSGTYQLLAYVRDSYGNIETKIIDDSFYWDKTPPSVDIQNKGLSSFSHIQGLDDLRIVASDSYSKVTIESVKITGGPINDDVNLLSRFIEKNAYGLEYPRMFPALMDNEKYTLIVTVTDETKNTTTISRSFTYIPQNYLDVGTIPVLAVNSPIQDAKGKVLTRVTSDVIRTSQSQLANGVQEVLFTLRSDSTLNVIIEGVEVAPGETKTVFIDISKTNSRIDVPVYPAVNGQEGVVNFLLEIPVIKSNIK
ncbi:Ig-like domain-containing protein (plasmid) [Psychrobium sp. nBUS_13]|uniref:Ig-like domain-containing protein n=1 Tax=Psychrobium sp. nBUS_13 TaxID=3395319 RepID=UPI003EB8E14F